MWQRFSLVAPWLLEVLTAPTAFSTGSYEVSPWKPGSSAFREDSAVFGAWRKDEKGKVWLAIALVGMRS